MPMPTNATHYLVKISAAMKRKAAPKKAKKAAPKKAKKAAPKKKAKKSSAFIGPMPRGM